MKVRSKVLTNVRRLLWGKSYGRCMNPDCRTELIIGDPPVSIADMAHIIPDSKGGSTSIENLILLCKNCHHRHETVNCFELTKLLREWKEICTQQNEDMFSVEFCTFDELEQHVRPLLNENHQIFKNYGPQTNNDSEVHKLWEVFEVKLLSNNAVLKRLLSKNMHLFDERNIKAIQYFIFHVDEFANTRDGFDGVRKEFFPWKILSIFGIQEAPYRTEQSISSIQNFIGVCQQQGHRGWVDFSSTPQRLFVERMGSREIINLDDTPRINQLLFSTGSYEVNSTDITLDGLYFTLKKIEQTGAKWTFENFSNLTIVTIGDAVPVKLFYSYKLTVADLQTADVRSVNNVANIYHWNGGTVTEDARAYAKEIGVNVLDSHEFSHFCYEHGS